MDLVTIFTIIFTWVNVLSAPTEDCNSLEYLEIGMSGIIECSFENIYAVSWFYAERGEPILLYRESEKSGIGYTSGEFDIHPNGSLVIKNVTLRHETIYRVSKFTSVTRELTQYHITVRTIVKPSLPYPVIDMCPTGKQSCLITVDVDFSIDCYVQNSRPLINLTWVLYQENQILPSVYTFDTSNNLTFTSQATVKYSFPQLSMLNVFVCQASGLQHNLITDRESAILIDRVFDYTAISSSTMRRIEVHSTMILHCSNQESSPFVWKLLVPGTELWSTILYNIPSFTTCVKSLQNDFELDGNGSLVVGSTNVQHEGLYVCIYNNDGREDVKVYEVEVYVNPVPVFPVVVGCNNQRYCVLHVSNGNFITCKVFGIRPVVKLEWIAFPPTDAFSFLDQTHIVEQRNDAYDVSLTSRVVLSTPSKHRATVKCSVEKSSSHTFEMFTTIDLLFENEPATTQQPTSITEPLEFNIFLTIVAIIILLMIVAAVAILLYLKVKASRKKKSQQSDHKDKEEEIPMMDATYETNKEDVFIAQLKAKYEMLYNSVQPIPYIRDRMYCVNTLFVESGIEYLIQSADARDKGNWKPLDSYFELLAENTFSSDRVILEGEPGYGKSTITLQLAYDWCNAVEHSPLSEIKVLIFLRLRQLGGVLSIFQAIRRFILPMDSTLTVKDIKNLIEHSTSVVIVLDGYDEYPDQHRKDTDIYKIISKDIFRKVKVLITTRSSYLPKYLAPQYFRVHLIGFKESARDQYIRKAVVGDDVVSAKNINLKLQDNPILHDLCQVPLFFVMFAHITHENKNLQTFKSVTDFFQYMIACFHSHMRNKMEEDNVKIDTSSEANHTRLDSIAFKALAAEKQQIVWERRALRKTLGSSFYNYYVKVGILVEDEILNPCQDLQPQREMEKEVRFFHKIFCEWYAAHFLAKRLSTITVTFSSTSHLLANVDPFDLQYIYRFACGISEKASNKIINYLRKTEGWQKFAILCTLEQTRETNDLQKSITELVSERLAISRNDTKLLQRATLQILDFASKREIPISELYLRWAFKSVDDGDIVLQSGLRLPNLSFLKKLSINGGREKISEDDVMGLLNNVLQSKCLEVLCFYQCELPESIRCDAIPQSSLKRNIKVMRPNHASQFDLHSGKWTKISDIHDIRQLCLQDVGIDQNISESVQKSVIDLLVTASNHDIPINRVSLVKSFHSIGANGDIILASGIALPILASLEKMGIITEYGRELDEKEFNGLLNQTNHSNRFKEIGFRYCLLPSLLSGSVLPVLNSKKVAVSWEPYGYGTRSYRLNLQSGHWLLHKETASLFSMKSTGDELTDAEYDVEVTAFRTYWSEEPWQKQKMASQTN